MTTAAGAKRPAEGHPGQYVPRKRAAADEDDFIEEDFDLEPPEDEDEPVGPDMEVRLPAWWILQWRHAQRSRLPLPACAPPPACLSLYGRPAHAPSCCHPAAACRWRRGRWGRRARTGRARPRRSSTPRLTGWVRRLGLQGSGAVFLLLTMPSGHSTVPPAACLPQALPRRPLTLVPSQCSSS